jgi:sec-independent protein translocase protein TatA
MKCYNGREATMGNIGATELLIIAGIALLLFGAGRLADIGKGLGQGIKNFKVGLKEAGEVDAKDSKEKGAAADAPKADEKKA